MKKLGTSSIVVAAFVGPGTVLTCASAGIRFSYSLGWVLVVATAAVFVLQTYTAGVGILAGRGMGELIREMSQHSWWRRPVFGLVLVGLWAGAAAFETGNVTGAAAGLHVLTTSSVSVHFWMLPCVILAAVILVNELRIIQQILTALVLVMSVFFLGAAALAQADGPALIRGLVVPSIPEGSLWTVTALVGTTVVTYNLFLHASAAKAYWARTDKNAGWKGERLGMAIFLPLGGLISLGILLSGAAVGGPDVVLDAVGSFATLLEPAAGGLSRLLFGLGLFAAGITSAVTAPLAVAAGITELFAWQSDRHSWKYRMVWISVLAAGTVFGLADVSPLSVIVAAQAANGFLLPIMAGIVVAVTMRQEDIPLSRAYVVAGILITFFCAALGVRTLAWVWSQFG